jgi:hypothetical protein
MAHWLRPRRWRQALRFAAGGHADRAAGIVVRCGGVVDQASVDAALSAARSEHAMMAAETT